MNKKGNENRSVRNTKKRLKETLLTLMVNKPINAISVKELTELADVNRGTFYFHYADIHDLLQQLEDEFFYGFDEILNTPALIKDTTTATSYLSALFAFLGENQEFCQILIGPTGDMAFINRLKKLVDDKCSDFWKQTNPNISIAQFDLYNAFIINGCIGIIEKWLADGLKETPEDLAELVTNFIKTSHTPNK